MIYKDYQILAANDILIAAKNIIKTMVDNDSQQQDFSKVCRIKSIYSV